MFCLSAHESRQYTILLLSAPLNTNDENNLINLIALFCLCSTRFFYGVHYSSVSMVASLTTGSVTGFIVRNSNSGFTFFKSVEEPWLSVVTIFIDCRWFLIKYFNDV